MADPWIKMRIGLVDDSAVMSLGTWLGTSGGIPAEVPRKTLRRIAVALLLETWGVFHREAEADGLLRGYDKRDIDDVVGIPSWCEAMIGVGWIDVTPDGLRASNFEKYIGSRKHNQRVERERKKDYRMSRGTTGGTSGGTSAGNPADLLSSPSLSPSGSVSPSEGEPEREPPATGTPLARALAKCLQTPTPEVIEAAKAWAEHAREIGNPLSEQSWRTQLAAAERDPRGWVALVRENLTANTRRLQQAPKRDANGRPRPHSSQDAFRSNLADLERHIAEAFPDNPAPRLAP